MKIKRVEELVKEILEEYPTTRNDDFILISYVYFKLCPEIADIPFAIIMLEHQEFGLPSFKSITRARRKIQAEYNDLKPKKEIQDIRKLEEQEYINYSKSR